MALTATQRKKLAAAGFDDKDLTDIEAELEDEEGPAPRRRSTDRKPRRRRVAILEGEEADEFLARLMGDGDGDGDGEEEEEAPRRRGRRSKAGEEEGEEEGEGEGDEKPPAGHKYFRG